MKSKYILPGIVGVVLLAAGALASQTGILKSLMASLYEYPAGTMQGYADSDYSVSGTVSQFSPTSPNIIVTYDVQSNHANLLPFRAIMYYNNPSVGDCGFDYTQQGYDPLANYSPSPCSAALASPDSSGVLSGTFNPGNFNAQFDVPVTVAIFGVYREVSTNKILYTDPYLLNFTPCNETAGDCTVPIVVNSVSPSVVSNDYASDLTLSGSGFNSLSAGAYLTLEDVSSVRSNVSHTVVNDATITFTLPSSPLLAAGDYIVILVDGADEYAVATPLTITVADPYTLDSVWPPEVYNDYFLDITLSGTGFSSLPVGAYLTLEDTSSVRTNVSHTVVNDTTITFTMPTSPLLAFGDYTIILVDGTDEYTLEKPLYVSGAVSCGTADCYQMVDADNQDNNFYGYAVDIDGNTAVVGSLRSDSSNGQTDAGVAFVYEKMGNHWIRVAKLEASDGSQVDSFGYSVAIDGDWIAIGTFADDTPGSPAIINHGSVYVFQKPSTGWPKMMTETQKLLASDLASQDGFGRSVALDGTNLVVGASGDDYLASDEAGAAYVFSYNGSTWQEEVKLLPAERRPTDNFGWSAAIDGDVIAIGAVNGSEVSVYRNVSGTWTLIATVTGSDSVPGDLFGTAVDLDNGILAVGAEFVESGGDSQAGGAYLFTGEDFSDELKLDRCDPTQASSFGSSVSIDGNRMVVGARADGNTGSAYVFEKVGDSWNLALKLHPVLNPQSYFGQTVALNGDDILVGAWLDDSINTDGGAAYSQVYPGPDYDSFQCTLICEDVDGDEVSADGGECGPIDNCPLIPNPDQIDTDGDGLGDACDDCAADPDNDSDGDSVCGNIDNCPLDYNPLQTDSDGDGQGDACDVCPNDPDNDSDSDGVCGDIDNCPLDSNPDQADADGDGIGDICDVCPNDEFNDADGDGVCGDIDKCPDTTLDSASIVLRPNNYAYLNDDNEYFEWNAGSQNSPNIIDSQVSLTDTYGCSCEQILVCKPGKNGGELKYGCTGSDDGLGTDGTMGIWINQTDWALECQVDGVITKGEDAVSTELIQEGGSITDYDGDGVDNSEDTLEDDADGDGVPDWWKEKNAL